MFKERHPGGVNSVWPRSHSKYSTLAVLHTHTHTQQGRDYSRWLLIYPLITTLIKWSGWTHWLSRLLIRCRLKVDLPEDLPPYARIMGQRSNSPVGKIYIFFNYTIIYIYYTIIYTFYINFLIIESVQLVTCPGTDQTAYSFSVATWHHQTLCTGSTQSCYTHSWQNRAIDGSLRLQLLLQDA